MAEDSDRTSDYRRLRRIKEQNPTRDVSSSSQIFGFWKPRISSMFLSSCSPSSSRKNPFSGLGCASPSPVSASVIVRSSANWQVKKSRRKMKKQKYSSKKQQLNSDVWCGPGMGFDADDCVVSQRPPPNRERVNVQKNRRERLSLTRSYHGEPSSVDFANMSSSRQLGNNFQTDGRQSHLHRLHYSHRDLSEFSSYKNNKIINQSSRPYTFQIMLLEANLPWEGHLYDSYGDLRLDVDNMTYEELIELGERIGTVNTGLKEDDILRYVKKMKAIDLASSSMCWIETERKCSVCLEEYKLKEEIGELKCGHGYHIDCIKRWLTQKNTCPVCKASASKF